MKLRWKFLEMRHARQAVIARLVLAFIARRGYGQLQMPAPSKRVLATYPDEKYTGRGRVMSLRDAYRLVDAHRRQELGFEINRLVRSGGASPRYGRRPA